MRRQTFSVVRREDTRARAAREARRIAELEREAFRAAAERCHQLDDLWRKVTRRLDAIDQEGLPGLRLGEPGRKSSHERFLGERALAEMALRDIANWEIPASAAYTIVAFANLRERLRFMTGTDADREALVREALVRGGVYTDTGYFQEILR